MYKAIRISYPASYTFSETKHVNTEKHIENLPLGVERRKRKNPQNGIGVVGSKIQKRMRL
jgi:hypothetical protein